jgi:5-methylcytosine-specific restriction endonuclease McrA
MNLANQAARAVPKPSYGRGKPKRGNRGKFSVKVTREIGERDSWRCVRCGSYYVESVPHHVIYKSQGGPGTVDNGVTICRNCHDWAHGLHSGPSGEPAADGRKWFEQYRQNNLLGGG